MWQSVYPLLVLLPAVVIVSADPCVSHPCQNNGKCFLKSGGFLCACLYGWTGDRCELDDLMTAQGRGTHVISERSASETCTIDPVDVVFVLDSTGSIGSDGFQKELDFVERFTNLTEVSEKTFHVGVVQFGHNYMKATIEFYLNNNLDRETVIAAVRRIQFQHGGIDYVDSGLEKAKEVLERTGRANAIMYVVLLTDGGLQDINATHLIAQTLKSTYPTLRIFIIGIGPGISWVIQDLRKIASSESYFLQVNQSSELASIVNSTVSVTCQDCTRMQCLNGGSCQKTSSGYSCACPKDYIGARCQDFDECSSNPCFNNATCHQGNNFFYCTCIPGYAGTSCETDIEECSSNPCQHYGTCIDMVNEYKCNCVPGYIGVNCEIDYNECESGPCQNGGTCVDLVNVFRCNCPSGFYEELCQTGICHPQPADMIFLLDSSISQTEENFKKQLDFVSNFTDQILIGPNDTQVSIITFSSEAYLEFNLSRYNNNATLKAAIQSVQFKPGITRTDKALQKAKEVAEIAAGMRRPNKKWANVFLFVITDGMSTYRQSTRQEASALKTSGLVKGIAAVGIGKEVSHQELRDIASSNSSSSSPYVFSLDNFDSLYTIVTQLVHITCQECSHSAVSDVMLMIDDSVNTTDTESKEDFSGLLNSISSIIGILDTLGNENNDTHISLASFSDTVRMYVNFSNYLSKSVLLQIISRIVHKDNVNSNIHGALHYINEHVFNPTNGGRPMARKFVVIFTNGGYNLDAVFELERRTLLEKGVKIITVGFGSNINIGNLLKIASSPYHVIVETSESSNNLSVLKRELVYDYCHLDFVD